MERFAKFVVHHRKLVLLIAVLLLIPSAFGAVGTYINYDILTYLPPELDSMVGEQYLENDFEIASTAMITVEHMQTADVLKMKEEIAAIPGVEDVMWTSDMVDVTVPVSYTHLDVYKRQAECGQQAGGEERTLPGDSSGDKHRCGSE